MPMAVKIISKVFGALAVCFCIAGCGLCRNEIFQEVYSPDHEYKAVVFQRDCGATTGWSTQISVLRAAKKLQNTGGNIFVMDGHPDWTDIRVNWDSDRSVTITYADNFTIFSKKSRYFDFLVLIYVYYQVNQSP